MKYNTIIFVPHARARFRKLTISTRFLGLSAAAAATLLVAAVVFGWAYFASARRDRQYRLAVAENARLRSSATALHQRLDGISRQLSEFEARTRRLAIVAGLSDSVRAASAVRTCTPEAVPRGATRARCSTRGSRCSRSSSPGARR